MPILKKKIKLQTGFTFIELLVVAAIMTFLFTLGTASLRNFQRRQKLDAVVRDFVTDLRIAQEKSLAGVKPVGCDQILQAYAVFVDAENDRYSVGPFCNISVRCNSWEDPSSLVNCDMSKNLPDGFDLTIIRPVGSSPPNQRIHFWVQGRGAWRYTYSNYYEYSVYDIRISYASMSRTIKVNTSGDIEVD